MRPSRINLLLLVIAVVALIGSALYGAAMQSTVISFSELKAQVAMETVKDVTFEGDLIQASIREHGEHPARIVTAVDVRGDDSLVRLLQEKKVPYGAKEASGCGGSGLLLAMLLTMSVFFFFTRNGGASPPGMATFGKSQARLAPEEGTGVTFADVAGIDEAEEELNEIVQFLKTPDRFTRLGGKIPKGVLLVGPPGTGKTLLARAVAGEAGVPFFSIAGSDFVEMFVGVGASRVRDLFKNAAERAPCIIFIDELDAIGKARGAAGPIGGHDEREQTLNQLLVEMDGFDGRKGIIIMAATNRPETLDPALLRAGRFDRQVVVDRPDVKGREAILRVHARGMRLAGDADLKAVAQRTPGFSGADLANALNEAALLAARREKDDIGLEDIHDAVERMVAGLEKKSRRLSEQERRVVAVHEAGHAVCGAGCPGSDPVQKISIIPRGMGALGYTLTSPQEDRYLVSRQELMNRMTVLFGGRAAEEMIFGDFTTGAADDINKASDLARRMVSEFGMSEKMGAINYGSERPNAFGFGSSSRDVSVSDDTARDIDAEVRRIVEDAHDRARGLVRDNRDVLDAMAESLLEHESLDGEALRAFLSHVRTSGERAAIRGVV